MTRVIKGHKLLREAFQAGKEDYNYESIIVDWEWDKIGMLIPRTFQTRFIVPCSKSFIEKNVTDYYENLSTEDLITLAKNHNIDAARLKQEGKIIFEADQASVYNSYTAAVRNILNKVALTDDVKQIFCVEQINNDEIVAGMEKHSASTVVEYIQKYYEDDPIFKLIAEARDIREGDSSFIEVAVYIGGAKILGWNPHDIETEEEVSNLIGEVQDYLEEEFEKNLQVNTRGAHL